VHGEVLGELEASELVVGHDTTDDTRLLQHDEVAVHGALGESAPVAEHLGNRERPVGARKDVDQTLTDRCHPLLMCVQPVPHDVVKLRVLERVMCVLRRHRRRVYGVRSQVMDVTERFAEAVAADDVALDVAALCIAAHAHPGLDIDATRAQLDRLAASFPDPNFDGLRVHLFATEGFRGNVENYADPANSFLDSVLERRLGIPITLSVLMMEVGRRRGVSVRGVGMPGHFLVKDGSRDDTWCDPFHGGARLDAGDCRRLFHRVHGSVRPFHPTFLAPTPPRSIVARMLTNLEHGPLAADPAQLAWICRLHLAIPELASDERVRLETLSRTANARWN
jgi:regulator of sirC expression with transglutaminase-like and TPR domain